MTKAHVHVPYDSLEEHLPFILRHRLNLEIYLGTNSLDTLDRTALEALRRILDYGPSLSIHAPFMDLSPGAVDSKVRVATIERFRQTLDAAEVLRPACIVFHSGYEKWKYALKICTWLQKSLETWQPLNERAQSLGVKEQVGEDRHGRARRLLEEQRGSSGAQRAVADLGHLQDGGDRGADAAKLAARLELGEEISEVGVLHGFTDARFG